MSCNMNLLEQFSEYKNGDNYVCSKEDFERVLTNSKNVKIKKKMCSYFIWMNEHRKDIEKEYFSDFYNIDDWTFENKKEYYSSKELDTNKVVKSFIASKEAIKCMQVTEKYIFVAGCDPIIRCFEIETGETMMYQGHKGWVY